MHAHRRPRRRLDHAAGRVATKRIPGATAPSEDVYAITGGTGAYVGATGSMKRSGNGKTDKLVFELR